MKTKIYILSLLGGLLLTMGSCLSDGKEDFLDEYASFLCILNSNEQEIELYNTGVPATYDITIDKGGYNLNVAVSAKLRVVSDFDIKVYNEENMSNFKLLPADCYELPADMSVSFGEKDLYQIKTVTFYPEKIPNAEVGETYVLMIELTESTSVINDKNKLVIVKPTVNHPQLSLEETGFKLPFTITKDVTEYTYELPVKLSTPLPEDLTLTVTVKQTLLDDYNTANSTDYKLMDEKDYEIAALTIAEGTTTGKLTVKVDITNMEGEYALPLAVTSDKYTFVGDNTIIIGVKNSVPKIELTADMLTLTGTSIVESDGGPIGNWVDDNTTTWAQVLYGAESKAFPHNLDVKLNNAISKLKVRYATRPTANQNAPAGIAIYVSNDGTTWTKKHEADTGFPTGAAEYWENCPTLDLGGSYTYVRFEVNKSTNKAGKTTWGMSEFELYGK